MKVIAKTAPKEAEAVAAESTPVSRKRRRRNSFIEADSSSQSTCLLPITRLGPDTLIGSSPAKPARELMGLASNAIKGDLGHISNQALIRYCLQKGWSPLPKSENPERIQANADVFGFELDEEDVKTLDGLDQGPAGAIVEAVEN